MELCIVNANAERLTGSCSSRNALTKSKTRSVAWKALLAIIFSLLFMVAQNSFAFDAGILIGDNTIEDQLDSMPLGESNAFPIVASATGTVGTMSVYIGPNSTVPNFAIGLYTDRGGHPYRMLGQGSIASPVPGAWNTIDIADVKVIVGVKYWIAILGYGGGKTDFRDKKTTACRYESSRQQNLSYLPSTWRTGQFYYGCPLSAYGIGTAEASTTAVGTLSAPGSVGFGSVTVGSSGTQNVTLKNTGTASLSISSANATGTGFSITGLAIPQTLTAGQSVTFSAKFAPTATGGATGSIALASDASNPSATISLSGTGAAVTQNTLSLSASPASTNFSNVQTGTTSMLPVILTNTGTGNVTLNSATASGTGFSVSGPSLPLTMTPGQTASFSVTFAPTSTGTFSGNVAFNSTATNPALNEPLAGAGVNAHNVALSWVSSKTTNVVGYHVYRGTQSGGPYARIDSSSVPNTSFNDSSVTPGQGYYYVTTAVDSNNAESNFSNESTAGVPVP